MLESGTLTFSISGEFIVQRAREIAWMDENRAHAMKILGNIVSPTDQRQGLSGVAIERILDGDATLIGDSNVGIGYVEQEDADWKRRIEERKDFFAQRALRRAQDAIDQQCEAERLTRLDELRFGPPTEIAVLDVEKLAPPVVTKKGATVRVLGRKVPKNLIEQYATVVRRIRRGCFLGVASEIANDPLAFFQLEERRVAIHDEILAVVGLARDTKAETDFSCALHERMDKLVGVRGEK